MGGDERPVTFGRWQEAHQALTARVTVLEAAASRGGETARWMLTLAVLSGLALPAVVLLIGVLIHRATA